MASTGRIFIAGPRGWRKYFPTSDQAAAAHDALVQQADNARREVKRRSTIEHLRRRKALSRMLGKSRNTRPDRAVQGEPSAPEFVVLGIRVKMARRSGNAELAGHGSAIDPRECRPWADATAGGRAA